jgi:hypothetical protein
MDHERKHLDIFAAIGTGFDWYARTWAVVVPIAYIVTALFALGQTAVVDSYTKHDVAQAILFGIAGAFVYFGANMIMQGAFIKAAQRAHDDQAIPGIGVIVAEALPFMWTLIGATIVSTIVVFLGILAFIIPGIMFGVWFTFIGIAVVLEGRGVTESLGRSREIVHGNWWRIFGMLLLIGIIVGLMSLVLGLLVKAFMPDNDYLAALVASIPEGILAPIGIHTLAAAYYQLRDTPSVDTDVVTPVMHPA